MKKINEEGAGAVGGGAPMNSAGSGMVAGIGVGPKGEPGVDNRKKKSPVLMRLRRKATTQVDEALKESLEQKRDRLFHVH